MTHSYLGTYPAISILNQEIGPEPFFSLGIAAFTYGEGFDEHADNSGFTRLFDAVCSVDNKELVSIYGMKSAVQAVSEAEVIVSTLQKYLKNIKVIFIKRDDIVAQYASLLIAGKTGKWGSFDAKISNHEIYKSMKINKYDFIVYANECMAITDVFRRLSRSHKFLEINYEQDILREGIENHDDLLSFLELTKVNLYEKKYVKMAPPPEKYIDNYIELIELLKNMESLADEGSSPVPESIIFHLRIRNKYMSIFNYLGSLKNRLKSFLS